jgi:hypothetical protein
MYPIASISMRQTSPGFSTRGEDQPERHSVAALGIQLAGPEYFPTGFFGTIARADPHSEVVDELPGAITLRLSESLLSELRDCAGNVYRFWQCVAQRMKPYDFYFLDPRLVSIEFRSTDQRRRHRLGNS